MANILVVDDTILTQRLLEVMLVRYNHTIVSALNGHEGLERLKDNEVDLVITDITMPIMDGLTFLDEVRREEKYKDLPIIVMTASGLPFLPKVVSNKGATIFLAQPFSSRDLTDAVNICLEQKVNDNN